MVKFSVEVAVAGQFYREVFQFSRLTNLSVTLGDASTFSSSSEKFVYCYFEDRSAQSVCDGIDKIYVNYLMT